MDEREILRIAAHHDIDEYLTEALTLEFVRDVLKADRRTTPDRDAIIEECARACERVAEGRSVVEMNVGAKLCADAVRALKTAPTAASSSEATDTERLNWLAWIGIAIRNEYARKCQEFRVLRSVRNLS
ncbi:hypothetical protein NUJ28_06180 [Burkholderia multivorans]|uniref:hypothetical protein n=1 Tax=Burkholderia multivorans TaxID=87883 RepID=UPI0021D949E8|nr:hypothetical protein [Burkholderia multivorans]UXZ62302.1 hypothetical protein NUJ28_06180 [Burkholderia multivorans]